jgi:DnaJ-class molecular chaperone
MPLLPSDDYYELLGVDVDADDEALRVAWRTLAARWHPDRAGAVAAAKFQRISAAYEVLSDPLARMAYDRRRRRGAGPAGATVAPPARAPARAAAPGVMLSRLSKALHVLEMTGGVRYDRPGFITLVLRPDEAAQGGMVQIAMRVDVWCPACGGAGTGAVCVRCLGRRTVEELFSAWLAVPPGVAEGEVLMPSEQLTGMVEPVRFSVAVSGAPS